MLSVRRMNTDAMPTDSRLWAKNDAFITHVLNTYGALVPGNEGFYIRTIRAILPRIKNAELAEEVERFVRQEGQHGVAHMRAWSVLEAQGYRFRGLVKFVNAVIYGSSERLLPVKFRMSMVACIEHINAIMGYEFLAQNILEGSEPRMRAVFEWHFAEEIEHRAVCFDAFQEISGSWSLRLLGAAVTVPLFYLLMSAGALWFMAQDRSLWSLNPWRGMVRHLFTRDGMAARSIAHLWRYLKPGFDPRTAVAGDIADATMHRWSNVISTIDA